MLLQTQTPQLFIDFVNEPVFTGTFGGQLKRMYELLKLRPVTCEDAKELGIAGSGFSRRIKDLRDIYQVRISIDKIPYIRAFDNKQVYISQYTLIK